MKRSKIQSIELIDISVQFQNGNVLFGDFNFSFQPGNVYWLRGTPGCGKSVLMKILAGLVELSRGQYRINGDLINDMSFEEFLSYRLNIGYSFDFGGLINNRTVYSNLALPCKYHGIGSEDEIDQRVDFYIKTFDLGSVAKERPSAIIGGQRKAACVARAFVLEPQVLLLDDPTTGLRGTTKSSLQSLLLDKMRHNKEQIIVISGEDEVFMKPLRPLIVEIPTPKSMTSNERSAA